jgi:hypothetical protein
MPRVRWEEQLCVSCEFVTKFAVYGFFAEHSGGLATDRALTDLLAEGLVSKVLEVPSVSRGISLQIVFEGTVRLLRPTAESPGPTESKSGRSVAKRIQLRKVVEMSSTKAAQD